jgi:hypothetical protein
LVVSNPRVVNLTQVPYGKVGRFAYVDVTAKGGTVTGVTAELTYRNTAGQTVFGPTAGVWTAPQTAVTTLAVDRTATLNLAVKYVDEEAAYPLTLETLTNNPITWRQAGLALPEGRYVLSVRVTGHDVRTVTHIVQYRHDGAKAPTCH